jgi:hypothetical protein
VLAFLCLTTGVAIAGNISVRVFNIKSGTPVRDVDVQVELVNGEELPARSGAFYPQQGAQWSRYRVFSSANGEARFDVPTVGSEDVPLLRVYILPVSSRGDSGYYFCGGLHFLRLEQVVKQGVLDEINCPYRFSSSPVRVHSVLAGIRPIPGQVITFVRPHTWREWFLCFVPFSPC